MGDERHSEFVQERRRFLGVPIDTPQAPSGGAPRARASAPSAAATRMPGAQEQQEHLERVSDRIAGSIIGFFATRAVGSEFHVDALRIHVAGECGIVAPDSPGRIMRAMRKRGAINYRVINRAQSRYRIITKGELS